MSLEFTESSAERQAICGPRVKKPFGQVSGSAQRECDLLPYERATLFEMKPFVAPLLFAGALSLISSTSAQAPAQKDDETVLQLVKEVQTQQLEIAANQVKIETKLADVAEAVRIARIYASRSR
jgi:hypothetical protein